MPGHWHQIDMFNSIDDSLSCDELQKWVKLGYYYQYIEQCENGESVVLPPHSYYS